MKQRYLKSAFFALLVLAFWLSTRRDLGSGLVTPRAGPATAPRWLTHPVGLAARLQRWELVPTGTEGYRKAEVTAGGIDTRELSSQTLESQRTPGLHFIGEVVDVTGWLGGYNFQWAWASAMACGLAVSTPPARPSSPA